MRLFPTTWYPEEQVKVTTVFGAVDVVSAMRWSVRTRTGQLAVERKGGRGGGGERERERGRGGEREGDREGGSKKDREGNKGREKERER